MKNYIQYLDSKGQEVLATSGQGGQLDGRYNLQTMIAIANSRMTSDKVVKSSINGYEVRQGNLKSYNVLYRTF